MKSDELKIPVDLREDYEDFAVVSDSFKENSWRIYTRGLIERIAKSESELRAALARIAELEEVIGETYQMVGAVSCAYPEIIPGVEKWLDHLSKGKLIHGSLLPFLPAESDLRAAHAKIAELEQSVEKWKRAVMEWEDREAAVCPEDVGFEEVMKAYESELRAARRTCNENYDWAKRAEFDLKRLRDAAVKTLAAIEGGKIYTRDGERILEALRSGGSSEDQPNE